MQVVVVATAQNGTIVVVNIIVGVLDVALMMTEPTKLDIAHESIELRSEGLTVIMESAETGNDDALISEEVRTPFGLVELLPRRERPFDAVPGSVAGIPEPTRLLLEGSRLLCMAEVTGKMFEVSELIADSGMLLEIAGMT